MKKKLYIEGMTCGHCAMNVTSALSEVCGVLKVEVNMDQKYAEVDLAHEVEDVKFKMAISEIGFDLIRLEA